MRNITVTYSVNVEVSFKRNKRFKKKPTWEATGEYKTWQVNKIIDFYLDQYPDLDADIESHGCEQGHMIRIKFENEADEASFILREMA